MFQKASRLFVQLSKQQQQGFATIKGGNLYTWGVYSTGTGFQLSNTDAACNVPKKVEGFEGNVSKVVMGPYHTAVITNDGQLYTMGCGDHGALGYEQKDNLATTPTLVEFFSENKLTVTDVVCGEHHTIVSTSNGELYSFGFGGTYNFGALDWLNPRTGALGQGSTQNTCVPQKIDGLPKVKKVSTGDRFAIAVTEQGEVFNWGCGADGSLADGVCEGVLTPQVNENFELLRTQEKLTIKEIRSASHFSVALMSDGNLYAWGRNNQGSLGIRSNLGHNVDEIATLPTKVVNQYFEGQKIVDYSVGENTLVVLTDKNQVFWSGMDLAYKPVHWDIPADKKITKVVASKDSLAALTQDGQIYTFNDFIARQNTKHRLGNEYFVAGKELFNNQTVSDIGGGYGIRYAITN